jgi:hypothetical protein
MIHSGKLKSWVVSLSLHQSPIVFLMVVPKGARVSPLLPAIMTMPACFRVTRAMCRTLVSACFSGA